MPILVLYLISFRGEASRAEVTLERLLSGMSPLVKLQVCQVVELNAANFNSVHQGAVAISPLIFGHVLRVFLQIWIHYAYMLFPVCNVVVRMAFISSLSLF